MPEDIFAPEQGLTHQQKGLLRTTVEEVLRCDNHRAQLKEELKRLEEQRKAKIASAVKLLIDAGTQSVKFDDGLMVTRRKNKWPSVAKEFWPKFKLWLQRNKYWGLATIHNRTLQGLLKDRLERGQSVPDYVKVFEEESLAISGKSAAILDQIQEEENDVPSPTV